MRAEDASADVRIDRLSQEPTVPLSTSSPTPVAEPAVSSGPTLPVRSPSQTGAAEPTLSSGKRQEDEESRLLTVKEVSDGFQGNIAPLHRRLRLQLKALWSLAASTGLLKLAGGLLRKLRKERVLKREGTPKASRLKGSMARARQLLMVLCVGFVFVVYSMILTHTEEAAVPSSAPSPGAESLLINLVTDGPLINLVSETPRVHPAPGYSPGAKRVYRSFREVDQRVRHRLPQVVTDLSCSIFTAPKPFVGVTGDNQRRALLSWLRLKPTPQIVLLGTDPTFDELVKEFSPYVISDGAIDYNYRGLPHFHSIFGRALAAKTNVSLVMNSDIILLSDMASAFVRMSNEFENWALTGMRWDIDTFPFDFQHNSTTAFGYDETVQLVSSNGTFVTEQEIALYVKQHAVLHTYGGVDFWAWNNHERQVPLVKGTMPPFAYGRARVDNWITHELIHSGYRTVVDGTAAATNIHVKHTYDHMKDKKAAKDMTKNFWSQNRAKTWESFLNVHLSQIYGSNFTNQLGTALHVPLKLFDCLDTNWNWGMCLVHRERPGSCNCEMSTAVTHTQTDPAFKIDSWKCGGVSVDKEYNITAIPTNTSNPGLPHRLEDLVQEMNKSTVVLTGAGSSYIPLLLSFACQLTSLGVPGLVIAAYDEKTYTAAFRQGLAVYYEPSVWSMEPNARRPKCNAEEPCGPADYAGLKAAAIQRVLKAGVNVLWSDVDVVWRTNPLKMLSGLSDDPVAFFMRAAKNRTGYYGEGSGDGAATVTGAVGGQTTIVGEAGAGEDEAVASLDTGFFFLPYSAKSEQLMEQLGRTIATSMGTPEVVMYLGILCGLAGERFDASTQECISADGLKVVLLDSALSSKSVSSLPSFMLLKTTAQKAPLRTPTLSDPASFLVLHLGGVVGPMAKERVMRESGMWRYNERLMMCLHRWQQEAQPAQWADTEVG